MMVEAIWGFESLSRRLHNFRGGQNYVLYWYSNFHHLLDCLGIYLEIKNGVMVPWIYPFGWRQCISL